jgi:hypothetical protein
VGGHTRLIYGFGITFAYPSLALSSSKRTLQPLVLPAHRSLNTPAQGCANKPLTLSSSKGALAKAKVGSLQKDEGYEWANRFRCALLMDYWKIFCQKLFL